MRAVIFAAAAGLLFAGCATSDNGRVYTTPAGTPVYGLTDLPQSSVAGSGTLMPGAYDSGQVPTGQFTGQERTHELVGQNPTLPRQADAKELERDGRVTLGTGAGMLGQTGIEPSGAAGSGSTAVEEPMDPRLIQPSASDIYRSGETKPLAGAALGNPPGTETGNAATNVIATPTESR